MKQILLIGVLLIAGCTSATRSQISALGGSQHVILYAASGQVIGEWDSDGVVHTETQSDGYYFTDKKTGKLVRVAGTIVITQN